MLKRILAIRKYNNILEEGLIKIQNNFIISNKNHINDFFDEFNDLVEEVINENNKESILSESFITTIRSFNNQIPIILKESNSILYNNTEDNNIIDIQNIILILKENINMLLYEDQYIDSIDDDQYNVDLDNEINGNPITYEEKEKDEIAEKYKNIETKTIFDWIQEQSQELIDKWQKMGLNLIINWVIEGYEEQYPEIIDNLNFQKYDVDTEDFQFFYLYHFPQKKIKKRNDLFTKEEYQANTEIIRRVKEQIKDYLIRTDSEMISYNLK